MRRGVAEWPRIGSGSTEGTRPGIALGAASAGILGGSVGMPAPRSAAAAQDRGREASGEVRWRSGAMGA